MKRLLLLAVFFSQAATGTANSDTANNGGVCEVSNAVHAWALSYLVNTAFIAEYHSVVSAGTVEDKSTLWQRAAYALKAALSRGQRIPRFDESFTMWRDQGLTLAKKDPAVAAKIAAVANAKLNDPFPSEAKDWVDPTFGETTNSLNAWTNFERAFEQPSPSCPLTLSEVRAYIDTQTKLTENGRTPTDAEILAAVEGWSPRKLHCLIFTMTAVDRKKQSGYDPLYLLQTLSRASDLYRKDFVLQAVRTVRLIDSHDYAEALRILFDLQQNDPAFRMIYEIVQRIYSHRHQGQGAVALKEL